ncbi:hypothetical protein NOR51B_2580 [Luminiphilus syltensis NOR5-1B]|uniref:Uncharacterized protein n=1 Tax=Luminiphilus syltensis NOR5-1B TaxID=565045 RepID=B8KRW5_9GAMM|nr:hypothetical protein [Luminiphilus syltensis]EED36628.1 hypothetical protein NOR51B_2580 [Luminiphilus syltensis NOR5-1B]
MNRIKTITSTLIAGSLALASHVASADISQECILKGRVDQSRSTDAGQEVRVTFHRAEHGDQARCRINKGNTKNRVQFKARPEDKLQELPDGAAVEYRYIERNNGQGQWQRLNTQT